MGAVRARDILHWDVEKVHQWGEKNTLRLVEFDDGVMDVTTHRIVFSWYAWVYHRKYPKTPLLTRHVMTDQWLSQKSHLELCTRIYTDTFEAYKRKLDIEDLARIAYEITNTYHNETVLRLAPYITSITILDFLEVHDHPRISAALKEAPATRSGIDHIYEVITDVLKDPNELRGNAVADAAKMGLVSMGQILQVVGVRGFASEADDFIFTNPIMVGYGAGITKLHDAMIDSRTATKALVHQAEALANSQYMNREIQLLMASVKRIHEGDCGTKKYMTWPNVKIQDFNALKGQYMVTDKGLVEITGSEQQRKELTGKTIRKRSVTYCNHPDPQGVCSTCFGALYYNLPSRTNAGHVSGTVVSKEASQALLKTKHLAGSSSSDEVVIRDEDAKYIRACEDGILKLAARLKGKHVKILVKSIEAPGITDISYVDDVSKLAPSRVSMLTVAEFFVYTGKHYESGYAQVAVGTAPCSLTLEALAYIKEHGYELSNQGGYLFDLKNWDHEKPLFELTLRDISMVAYTASIKSFIMGSESGKKSGSRSIRNHEIPDTAILDFHDLVSSMLSVNVAYLEMVLLGLMVKSEDNKDFSLPKNGEGHFSSYRKIMSARSLGAAMAYERHYDVLTSPESFTITNRPSHSLDSLLVW